jgi:hypothetical protein
LGAGVATLVGLGEVYLGKREVEGREGRPRHAEICCRAALGLAHDARLPFLVRACGHAPKERSMLTHPSAWEWEQAGRALSLTGRQ